jgi:choline dehydrogenase-like flavoprotein
VPTTSNDVDTYDFIVTGAGSAGCAVAARLSESGRHRVLLLEAGGKDSNPWIHIPLGYTKTYTNPAVNWMFESEAEKELNNRTMYQPRGKVLGGTSSINGMVYMRGNHADYDDWRQRGCTGWDWDSVLPYFKSAAHCACPIRPSAGSLATRCWQPPSRPAYHATTISTAPSRKVPASSRPRPRTRAAGAPRSPI